MSQQDPDLFILLVDDSMFMRQKTAGALEQEATLIKQAEDGFEAVAVYRNCLRHGRAPDAVLMDITMPRMDGIQATREILALDPKACIIIASAIGQEDIIHECINIGAADYLIKPYRFEKLRETLESAIVSPYARRVLAEMAG